MAPRKKTLLEEMESCANSIGGTAPPDFGTIKGLLIRFIAEVREFQGGSGFSELEAENESLKSELEALKGKFEKLKTDQAAEVKILGSELDALLKEKAKREEKDPEIPAEQLEILTALAPKTVRQTLTWDLRQMVPTIPEDELAWHLGKLQELGYISFSRSAWEAELWFRTDRGNALVIAKRKAGEDKAQPKNRKYPELPELEAAILKTLTADTNGMPETLFTKSFSGEGLSEAKITFTLNNLEKRKMVWSNSETYGTPTEWHIDEAGKEYLAERDLL